VACTQKGVEAAEMGGRAPAEVGTERRSGAATDESRRPGASRGTKRLELTADCAGG